MGAARKSHTLNSTLLSARLKERIARKGPISVAEYMEACLADQDGGYYRSRQPIGADGDFITAPEVSQIFGELLGLWAVAVWQSMGEPKPVFVAELGPGRGTLMSDAMRAWRSVPEFLENVIVMLVETSPVLREVQQTALYGADLPIEWRGTIEDIPHGPLIVIANEFVDALPVRQLVWHEPEWRERCVRIGPHGGFDFCEGSAIHDDSLLQFAGGLDVPDGSILEIRPAVNALVSTFAARAQSAPFAALIIDYGHEQTACGDTLQAISQHRFADPLETPGEVDVTAHVDFAALKDAALAQGLAAYGPIPQGAFLLQLGLEARRNRLSEGATEEQRQALITETSRLVDPSAMGLLFKALAITNRGLAPPPPFGEIQ